MKLQSLALICDQRPADAAFNMALDEALFLAVVDPIFRSYRWMRPSVSFGYFMPWRLVLSRYPQRDLVRRWTGGGMVEHGQDFTYSLILPADRNPFTNIALYRFVHRKIADLLSEQGYSVEVVSSADLIESNACFEQAVEYDLTMNGEKVAGAAIRRRRNGILLQGSIQRLALPDYFGSLLGNALAGEVKEYAPSLLILETAARIANEKYGSEDWTCRF